MKIEIKKMIVGPIRTNCYIVNLENSNDAVIIDPGDEASVIEKKLSDWKLNPVAILLTHGHIDHIGGVNDLRKRFGMPVYACDKEEELLKSSDLNLSRALMGSRVTVEADKYLKDGDVLEIAGIKFKMIYTPGHTIGSCCFYVEDNGVLFSGDTLFRYSHGRTDFPTGSQSAIIRSITDKLLVLDENTLVYPGHESETTIGSEKENYGYY